MSKDTLEITTHFRTFHKISDGDWRVYRLKFCVNPSNLYNVNNISNLHNSSYLILILLSICFRIYVNLIYLTYSYVRYKPCKYIKQA